MSRDSNPPNVILPVAETAGGLVGVHMGAGAPHLHGMRWARDGEDLRGKEVFVGERGSGKPFERLDLGAAAAAAGCGPAQVATEAYRSGWEATFGAPARGGVS